MIKKLTLILSAIFNFSQAYRQPYHITKQQLAQTRAHCYPPMNLTKAQSAIVKFYESGCVDIELKRIINKAINYFKAHPCIDGKKCAVVFDLDQTIFDGYKDFKSIKFGYVPEMSHRWVMKANAHAIEPTRKLYDYLVNHGFRILFLSGRRASEFEATKKNLALRDFCIYDKLVVRNHGDTRLASIFKNEARQKFVDEGYTIVGNIGDQCSDMWGSNNGYKVKLPNYMYEID